MEHITRLVSILYVYEKDFNKTRVSRFTQWGECPNCFCETIWGNPLHLFKYLNFSYSIPARWRREIVVYHSQRVCGRCYPRKRGGNYITRRWRLWQASSHQWCSEVNSYTSEPCVHSIYFVFRFKLLNYSNFYFRIRLI